VRVNGAKNATLPILAACLLTRSECAVLDAPRLRDTAVMQQILTSLGVRVTREGADGNRQALVVQADVLQGHEVPDRLVGEMRSSIFLMGPLLARVGRVKISHPGGCAIGPRPIDLHLTGLQALGVSIREHGGYIEAETPGLQGAEIHLDFPSVGATENLMMAATLAQGTTLIRNAAKEPEIVDLQNFLNALGARIRGAGTGDIRVDGTARLGGAEHTVIPDRIEAGTLLAAVGAVGGEISLTNVIPEHLEAMLAKLRETGLEVWRDADALMARAVPPLRATDFKTLPYPGFPTDMQPQVMAMMCTAQGLSIIGETIFPNRFNHAAELRRMGADIRVEGAAAVVRGVPRLSGASVQATDLRSGAALILAGLGAEGTTEVYGAQHVDRGYERLECQLQAVGADVRRRD
jgi:UDP-N-acetylglucosamine 1-carboxyvinyltransferase